MADATEGGMAMDLDDAKAKTRVAELNQEMDAGSPTRVLQ
jgi:hypothetical protein